MQGEKLFSSGYIRKKPHGASPFLKTKSPGLIYNKRSNLREIETQVSREVRTEAGNSKRSQL